MYNKAMPRNVPHQLKMLSMMIFVLVLLLMTTSSDFARAFHWLSTLWMKMMNVADPLVGPNGIRVYVPFGSIRTLKGKLFLTG